MMKLTKIDARTRMLLKSWRDTTVRERDYLVRELAQVAGLMPLLMKRRNSQKWSVDERAQLAQQLRRLSHLSPYIAVIVLPGGLLMLPALAWWLDRRRNGTRPGATRQP
ncbi:MAG: hypothetical protein ACT4PS_05855 [Betaproteobacteria bacterium]